MSENPTKQMLEARISRLFEHLRKAGAAFDTAVIVSKINQYYFTGTMQDGILILRKEGTAAYFVRKSYDRARTESSFDNIYPISSYRDILAVIPANMGSTYMETEIIPHAMIARISKYFTICEIHSIDKIIMAIRSVKSDYELDFIIESGKQHQYVMENIVPSILREGMSETDFAAELYSSMIKLGHHGVSRFAMFQIEMIIGQFGFGENSIYPTCFDGPGGMFGLCPAAHEIIMVTA